MKRYTILCASLALLLVAQLGLAGGDQGCTSTGILDADTLVKTGSGALCSVLVLTDGTNPATAVVYDNTTANGKALFKAVVPGASNFGGGDAGSPIASQNGIYVDVTGTGANVIVYYR